MGLDVILYVLLALGVGVGSGYFFKSEDVRAKSLKIEAENERKIRKAEQKIHEIEKKSQDIALQAKEKAHSIVLEAKDEAAKKIQEVEKQSARAEQKEGEFTKKLEEVAKDQKQMEKDKEELVKMKENLQKTLESEQKELEKIAGMKKEEAKEMLFEKIEKTAGQDMINRMKRSEDRIKEEADVRGKEIIIRAIQRMVTDVTNDATVTPVALPSDDLKGRVIGKEGRNIQMLERMTGCDIIIDDTPNTVILAGYDLMRRYIAKRSLERLVEDGRINPPRIEETVEKVTADVDKMVKEFGEQAVTETGVMLPPEVVKILGRLKFRTSYGQNVLKHSIEVAFLAESLANMLGADAAVCKAAGLVHDIGKTVSQEIGGKHAVLTGEILRKFSVDEAVCTTAEAHHEDFPVDTTEKVIIQLADAISASRPGSRRETAEKFIQRMQAIENTATSFGGVEKCYAIQAGREVRVFVNPEDMDDLQAKQLSWDIARKLEADIQFPGEIKVMVMRETRNIETAK